MIRNSPFYRQYEREIVVLIIAVLCALAFSLYAFIGMRAGDGVPLMPVDDAYIHFQYARQIARGELYQYNPGLPPTSGATSLLYPYLLSIGSFLGLEDLQLGWWALFIGACGLFASSLAVFNITRFAGSHNIFAVALALAFILHGAMTWHAFSGMETMLLVSLLLWTLWGFLSRQFVVFIVATALLAVTRPEGSILAVFAVVAYAIELRQMHRLGRRQHLWLLVPVLFCGLQPLINWVVTGSFAPTGNQAKSLFGMIPFELGEVLRRVVANFSRAMAELVTGFGEHGVPYLLPGLAIITLTGVVVWSARSRGWGALFLILAWMLVLVVAIATLDTAFWHFKRYQMPLFALILALVAFSKTLIPERFNSRGLTALVVILMLFGLWSTVQFLNYYAMNTHSVATQPLAMAQWLSENTAPESIVAVHDVGVMRYLGDRTTVDMVGLTTAGAAEWWRNGPGAVGEYLTTLEPRPDYIAAYNDARGLSYLAQTSIYGELLQGFDADFDARFNVALGGHFQGVYRPTWVGVDAANNIQAPLMLNYLNGLEDAALVDQFDVADLHSEYRHQYAWDNQSLLAGFATELYQQQTLSCAEPTCVVTDGGRRLNGAERFQIIVQSDQDVLLITRVHPLQAGTLHIYANEQLVAEHWIPSIPGQWLEIPTLIPSELVTTSPLDIRIVPQNFVYMPYMHWVYQGHFAPPQAPTSAVTPKLTLQAGAIQLAFDYTYAEDTQQLDAIVNWQMDANAQGDALFFVHLYDDLTQPPVMQVDARLGQGGLIIQNALPGWYADTYLFSIDMLPAGTYTLAIGMYDPVSGERTPVDADATNFEFEMDTANQRVILGQIEVPTDAR
jgi:hypothetical protein